MTAETDLDVLDTLADFLAEVQGRFESSPSPSSYVEGQLAFIEEAQDRIQRAPATATPAEVLEEAASELGLRMEEDGIRPRPSSDREVGIVSMWSLSLGYADGIVRGAEEAMTFVDDHEGVTGSFSIG